MPNPFQTLNMIRHSRLDLNSNPKQTTTTTTTGIATGKTFKTVNHPIPNYHSSSSTNCKQAHQVSPMADNPKIPQPTNVLHGKYELGRLLGHGNFAKVYHAKNLHTGESVAVKVVSKEEVIKTGMTEQVKREISVMKKMNHPNIVKLYEVMASKSKIYIAMEYIRGGELFDRVVKGRLREDLARSYFQQLISAIEFCHSRGVYHRDLKPENLLLDEDGNLKVTDFGLSALSDHLKQDGLLHTLCGTPAYVAPEVIGNRGYHGAKSDLWSCGVILFVLLAGYLPFQDQNVVAMYRRVCRGDFKFPTCVPPESRRIITRLLDPNPMTRITTSELMETSWFKTRMSRNVGEDVEKSEDQCTETLNAFHIISLSEGFDLSPLFEGKRKQEELRFATASPASSVISRLEEVAKRTEFRVKRSEGRVRLQGRERGRKGKLWVAAEMFAVTPAVMVVEVKKEGGDTLEYNQFCSEELRPALQDIIWSENSMTA